MSLRAWWDKLLGRPPAEEHRGLFDRPPRRTPEEQAVIDEQQGKLHSDERREAEKLAASTAPLRPQPREKYAARPDDPNGGRGAAEPRRMARDPSCPARDAREHDAEELTKQPDLLGSGLADAPRARSLDPSLSTSTQAAQPRSARGAFVGRSR